MAKKEKVKKKRHTFRTIVIVIVVIIILAIIGGAMGGSNDGNEEASTETATGTMTEAVADEIIGEETESEAMTADEALQEYVDSNASGLFSKPYTINRIDLTSYLADSYPEEEATEAVEDADIDWNNYAIEYENYLLKDKEVYHEEGLREQLADKGFTQDEIDYAIDNVDWTLQKDILDFVDEYKYNGIEDDPDRPGQTIMFWNVNLNEDANTNWWNDDDFKEVAKACMQQPENQENNVDNYGIQVFDADGQLIYSWLTYDDKYTISQYDWSSSQTNPHLSEWKLSSEDYNDILSAGTEEESEIIPNSQGLGEIAEEESSSSSEWDAGDLAYLNMSRDELLTVYNAYDEFISEETAEMSADEAATYEDESAEQVASEYGISADDVKQIFSYGSNPGYFATSDMNDVTLPYGEVQSVTVNGSEASIKVKVPSLISNQQTIDQNYYNVCDFIRDYAKTDYDKISYWAVSDTTDGEETKIISFDLSGDIINTIATQDFPDNTLGDYVENLYILPSLQE